MNSKDLNVVNLIDKMRELGVEPDNRVMEALRDIRDPYYRIGLVGRFQTGKTHIVNKVFLENENLLAEGIGLCKTAVTVEIKYGSSCQFSYNNGEEVDVITNPTGDAIAQVTAATEDEDRLNLFHGTSNAVLAYPNELLKNISIYDTPGIDDPNEELLRETTYRLLPQLDMAVMVIAPKALSQTELRFLQKKIFSCGISHFMILVSCKPFEQFETEDEDLLRDQLQNQLRSIGREDIPVFFYREMENGRLIMDNRPVAEKIIEIARKFTMSNRCGKLRLAISAQLNDEITKLRIASAVYGKDQAELIRMKSEAIQALSELRQFVSDSQEEFAVKLSQQRILCVHGFEADIMAAQEKFITRLKEADGLGAAQELLNNADTELQRELEDIIIARMQSFYDTAVKLTDELRGNLKKQWQKTICPLMYREVDGGNVQRWNSILITCGDYILSAILLPGGVLLSIGLRWLLGRIPVIKSLMPANLAKDHMICVAEESLQRQMPHLIKEFAEHIAGEQKKICSFLADANQKEINHQQELLDTIAEKEVKADAEFDVTAVRKRISGLGDLLQQLF